MKAPRALLLALALLALQQATAASATIAGVVMNGSRAVAKLSSGSPSFSEEGVIQRQTYAFPEEYAAIDCGLTLTFSTGTVFGPLNVRLQRDEPTTTTRYVHGYT